MPDEDGLPALPKEGALDLTAVPLYISSTSVLPAGAVTGRYYLWSSTVVSGRVRITNNEQNIGITGQVTGWIDQVDAVKSAEKEEETAEPIPSEQGVEAEIRLEAFRQAIDQIRTIIAKL